VIGRDVGQHRHIAVEALGQVDLIARQFEHIDATFGQRIAAHDRQADIPAHQAGDTGGLYDVMDQCRGGRFAVGAGDTDDLVRGQFGARLREQLYIADHRYAELRCMRRDWMLVQRHAGRNHDSGEAGQIGLDRIGQSHPALNLRACLFLAVPGGDLRARGKQRLHRGKPRASEAEHGIMFSGEGAAGYHRSFSVARPMRARTKLMIQKRITTVGSLQPSCSK
jgi:hypothetical protein